MTVPQGQLPDPQTLYEHAACGLLLTDADGTIRRANATFCNWIGRPAKELIGSRRLQDMLTIGGRIFHETHWAPLLQMQSAVAEIKLDLQHRDGRTVPMLMNAVRRKHGDTVFVEVAVMVAVDRDKYERELLLARRQAEKLLDEAHQTQRAMILLQARLQLAMASAGLRLWELDAASGERRFDDDVALLLGHDAPAAVSAQDFLAAIEPDDRGQEALAFSQSAQADSPSRHWRFRLNGVDGQQRTISASGRAVRDAGGKLLLYVGVLQDVTELARQAEDAQHRAHFAEQMVGIVSHDLRNPLSAIQMSGALLARDELTATQNRIVKRIGLATERAQRLIGDLLDLTAARLGTGLKVVRQTIDLHAVIGDSIDELQTMFIGHRIEHRADGSGRASADAGRLVQLVGNLVANAIAYGAPGQTVSVKSTLQADTFTLSVHNHGTPIADELLPLLFEPMTRGAGASNADRSVGLGLFIVREIVRAHGGEVAVTSNATSGTTVRARFPRFDADGGAPEASSGGTRSAATANPQP